VTSQRVDGPEREREEKEVVSQLKLSIEK